MSSNEIISQAILARMATQNYQVKQLAKDLGTTREATGRRLNQHTIWDSDELDIVGKALGLTDMFGLCDYARALAEMNKNVPPIQDRLTGFFGRKESHAHQEHQAGVLAQPGYSESRLGRQTGFHRSMELRG